MEALIKGPLRAKDIAQLIKLEQSGVLTDYLNDLCTAGFLQKDFTWSMSSGLPGRVSYYRLLITIPVFIVDEPNKMKIESAGFSNQVALPNLDSIMGLQFENLVLNNREYIWHSLAIELNDIVCNNPYFKRKQNVAMLVRLII